MKCVACHRSIEKPTAVWAGVGPVGPVCAVKLLLVEKKQSTKPSQKVKPVWQDQPELFEVTE